MLSPSNVVNIVGAVSDERVVQIQPSEAVTSDTDSKHTGRRGALVRCHHHA